MISKLATRENLIKNILQYHMRRCLSTEINPLTGRPKAAKQLVIPATEKGFFNYERYISRDKRYDNPQVKGDTPMRFLFRRLGHAYEVYPIVFLIGSWFILFILTSWWSFQKIEVWLDRSHKDAPWSWERIRGNYWNSKKVFFDLDRKLDKRLEIMEVLQDEMLEAAKKKGLK